MTFKLTIIAVALTAIAVPASAAAEVQKQTAAAAAKKETKYCITYEASTGSRLTKQECKTKQQWADEGVDIDKLLNK